jgi:nitroreductase
MKFLELAEKRQSVRKYSNKAVEREKIDRCLKAAQLAPSACNSQPWHFIIVDEPSLREQLAKETYNTLVAFNKFAVQAPVLVVLVMEKPTAISQIGGRIKNRDFYLMDVGIGAEHFCLQAAEEGLGTCMMGWFNEKKMKKMLGIPDKRSIGLVITLGYPETEEIRPKKRKTVEEISQYNKY